MCSSQQERWACGSKLPCGGEPEGKLVPGAAGKGWGSLAVGSTPGGAWGEKNTWLKHQAPLRSEIWPLGMERKGQGQQKGNGGREIPEERQDMEAVPLQTSQVKPSP